MNIYTVSRIMESFNFTYYHFPIPENEANYNSHCFVKEGDGVINSTSIVYSELLCKIGFTFTISISICGTLLNSLTLITLLYNKSIRKERFTPIIISLASCNLLFSIIVLPIKGSRFYYRS